jgi:hypothetical protein
MKSALIAMLALVTGLSPFEGIQSFIDEDYQTVLRTQPRVLFYSFSPSMPLSVEGLKEVRLAADALRATLVVLADPAATETEIVALGDPGIRYQKSTILRNQGIQLHYPSILVSNNHKIEGAPIAGFKTHSGYVTLVSDLLKLSWKEEFKVSRAPAVPRSMNAFFKPIYGTDLIASGSSYPNYLFNLKTGAVFNAPGSGDPGPTPDGEFGTLLSGVSGLSWYSIPEALAGSSTVLMADPGLRTYQSVGQLSPSTYRVVGAVSSSTNPAGLIVRDYERKGPDESGSTVAPLTEWHPMCEGKRISIPMLSKTGTLLSGSFEGSLRVFRIGANATECEEVFDTKVVSGKADFSRDDGTLAYVARAVNPRTSEDVDAVFLANLRGKSATPIYYAESQMQLAFPGFMSPDRIAVYDQNSWSLFTLDRVRTIQ